ncbi:hypothetical protein Tco_1020376 [Tanacetum coccineum]|uniref:Uncharacterized protein n=1 Tax=Tanacetum coccineum TaxID=301880 RepID=A0ABQ5FZU3_9ASTR
MDDILGTSEYDVTMNEISDLKSTARSVPKDYELGDTGSSNGESDELKKLIEKCKGKSVETQFDKPFVVRQPNVQRIPKPSVLGKPAPFSNSLELRSFQTKQSVNKTNVSDGSSKQVTQLNLPKNRKQAKIHTNTLTPGMYRIAASTTQNREPQLPHASRNTNPHVSTSTGVNHSTSVSRPPLKSYQVKDKVMPNNSQVKTSNVNVVCAECGKYVFNSNHDACVSKYLNDVNARTKKPKVVPISASKPKSQANKSVATTHKKIVASDTTIQIPKSYFKELPRSSMFKRRLIATDQASVFMAMMSVHISSSLVLHQMTSDHNRSELGIQDHSNEQSSSKLVPKVVP